MTIRYIDKTDKFMLGLYSEYVYERQEISLVRKLLKPGQVFVDVGAHIGYYTTLAAELVGPKGHVYAFEPNPRNANFLRKNTMQFGETIHIIEAAVSNYIGCGQLYLNPEHSGDHRIYESSGRESIDIDVMTLDSALEGVAIDFIKIDTQGAEKEVLMGAEKVIQGSSVMCGIVEFIRKRSGLIERLIHLGFDVFTFKEKNLVRLTGDVGNKKIYKNLFIKKGLGSSLKAITAGKS